MREPYGKDIKEEILETCFMYFVKKGLEKASVKNLCDETGISSGSIYYWFSGRDEVIVDATKYGTSMILDKLFDLTMSNIDNLYNFLRKLPDELIVHKEELKFIYQVASSEQYGPSMRGISNDLKNLYALYADKLAKQINVDAQKLKPFLYLIGSSILNYSIWEDHEIMQDELDCICNAISKMKEF